MEGIWIETLSENVYWRIRVLSLLCLTQSWIPCEEVRFKHARVNENPMGSSLLVSQRIDGVDVSRFEGRIGAEHDPNQ